MKSFTWVAMPQRRCPGSSAGVVVRSPSPLVWGCSWIRQWARQLNLNALSPQGKNLASSFVRRRNWFRQVIASRKQDDMDDRHAMRASAMASGSGMRMRNCHQSWLRRSSHMLYKTMPAPGRRNDFSGLSGDLETPANCEKTPS
jgi:hypothetical protein